MLFVATLMGLALQAFTEIGFPWRSAVIWGHYLSIFKATSWFAKRPVSMQAFLLFIPVIVVFILAWPVFAKLFWGLGVLLFYVLCFSLCCDGYRYIEYLGQFANPDFTRAHTVEEGASSGETSPDSMGDASPSALFEVCFGKPAPEGLVALRSAVLSECFVHLNLYLFVPLFWFLWFGPLAALVVALSLAIAQKPEQFGELSQRLSRILHWVSWVPARLFSLALFLIQRAPHTTLREWWSLVKCPKQEISALMLVTIKLSMLDSRPFNAQTQMDAVWDSAAFVDAQRLCQRAVTLWVGAFAVCALVF